MDTNDDKRKSMFPNGGKIALLAILSASMMGYLFSANPWAEKPLSANELARRAGLDYTCTREGAPPIWMFKKWPKNAPAEPLTKFRPLSTITSRHGVELKVRILTPPNGESQEAKILEILSEGVPLSLLNATIRIKYAVCYAPGPVGYIGIIRGILHDEGSSHPYFRPK